MLSVCETCKGVLASQQVSDAGGSPFSDLPLKKDANEGVANEHPSVKKRKLSGHAAAANHIDVDGGSGSGSPVHGVAAAPGEMLLASSLDAEGFYLATYNSVTAGHKPQQAERKDNKSLRLSAIMTGAS